MADTKTYQTLGKTRKDFLTEESLLLRAYKTYQAELAAGGDGRPDFVERKTCNWITDTFQVVTFRIQVQFGFDPGLNWITTNTFHMITNRIKVQSGSDPGLN